MSTKSIDEGGLPFFRYSKVCMAQWFLSIGLFIYGLTQGAEGVVFVLTGLVLFVLFPVINEIILNACSHCQKGIDPVAIKAKFSEMKDVFPIVYSPGYNITAGGFEKCHPFDSTKYKRIWHFLHSKNVLDIETQKFYQPSGLPSRRVLQEVMTPCYLFTFNYSVMVCKYLELPLCFLPGWFIRSQVLEPMTLGTVGSVESSFLAMQKGWAINLSGGFHHASRSNGEGFCIYPDITFITHYLRQIYMVKRIMIIDLDAHQGNGHERDHLEEDNTYIIDAYNHRIYPGDRVAMQAIKCDIDVRYSTSDEQYLADLEKGLSESFRSFNPEFVIYNAGTDCLIGDPLGALGISEKGIIQRDELLFKHCLQSNIPVVMLMSGGYQQNNAEVIADSIANLIQVFDLKKYKRD